MKRSMIALGDGITAVITAVVAAGGFAVSPPAAAQEALAQKYGCLACHKVDQKLVGPAYKDVAAKYRGNKGAETKLAEKVKKGGVGVWGQIPMPANPSVPDKDLHALVKWVLSQK
jgi:cytochrome c